MINAMPLALNSNRGDQINQIRKQYFKPVIALAMMIVLSLFALNWFMGFYPLTYPIAFSGLTTAMAFIFLQRAKQYKLSCWTFCIGFVLANPINVFLSNGLTSPMLVWAFVDIALLFYFQESIKAKVLAPIYSGLIVLACFLANQDVFSNVVLGSQVDLPLYRAANFALAFAGVLTLLFFYHRMISAIDASNKQLVDDKRRLVHILFHDIMNPASFIDGLLRYGDEGGLSNNDILESVQKSNTVILDILNSVRNLECLQFNEKVEVERLDLEEVFEQARFIFSDKLAKKAIKFNFQTPKEKVFVYANKCILHNNVFNNLIANAIKYSEPGSTITVSATVGDGTVELAVRDQGSGISKEVLDRLNSSLPVQPQSGTRGERGSGLGLEIVKASLDRISGQLYIESKTAEEHPRGHGTLVKLYLKKAAS